LNNTFLNDQWVIEDIREEIKKFLKFGEYENTTYQINKIESNKTIKKQKSDSLK
jgi:hypothetical protein